MREYYAVRCPTLSDYFRLFWRVARSIGIRSPSVRRKSRLFCPGRSGALLPAYEQGSGAPINGGRLNAGGDSNSSPSGL
jgi:hypothetical protein